MESEKKELNNTIFILCIAFFTTIILCGKTINDNSRLEESEKQLTDSIINLNERYKEKDTLYQLKSQIILRIMNVIPEKHLKVLQDDEEYMNLTSELE